MSKNKFQYAEKDTLPSKIEDKDVTVQISLKIEGDLLKEIRAKAAERNLPYQTFMKQIIRLALKMNELNSIEVRIARMEEQIQELEKKRA